MAERSDARLGNAVDLTPKTVLAGFGQYGLSLQLLSDSLHIDEMNLPGKNKLKLPVSVDVNEAAREEIKKLRGFFSGMNDRFNFDQTFVAISERETHLGHLRPAIKFAEYIRSPQRRFKALLHVGQDYEMPNPDVEEALRVARATGDEVFDLKERVGALAWSGWIDKQLGIDSHAFGAAEIAFRELTVRARSKLKEAPSESSTTDALRDVSVASVDIATVASELGKDPQSYLTVGKVVASDIASWSESVRALSGIVRAESSLGLDYQMTLVRLKEKITVDKDAKIHDSNIGFWLQVVELEKAIGADWQKSLAYTKELCEKIDYDFAAAQAYKDLAEFEAKNGLDPSASLDRADKSWKKIGRLGRLRIRTMDTISNWGQKDTKPYLLAVAEQLEGLNEREVQKFFADAIRYSVEIVDKRSDRDQRTEGYLDVASDVSSLGVYPVGLIDLAKKEVYTSSHKASFAHRLKILGQYQRSIGDTLHSNAYNILSTASPEQINEAFMLALKGDDRYPLIGFGAHIPVRMHETLIQGLSPKIQARVRRDFSYGAALSQ